eukprot:2285371-Karenia_brevis.AAC.1
MGSAKIWKLARSDSAASAEGAERGGSCRGQLQRKPQCRPSAKLAVPSLTAICQLGSAKSPS